MRPNKTKENVARTRVKTVSSSYKRFSITEGSQGSLMNEADWILSYETMSDRTVKPCQLSVEKQKPFSGILRSAPDWYEYLENFVGYYVDPKVTMYVWQSYVNQLNHKKLPTSNQADILTNLAEFDDTVAALANPLKTLSYGGVKWGWMPLISDINAVNDAANAVKNSYLDNDGRTSKYSSSHRIQKTSPKMDYLGGTVEHRWDVTVRYSGTVTYDNDILAFYDYMGFHPTPKVLWDIVPLSFAIDYVLPIGETLKRMSPAKGWVKAANFTGWQVITAVCTEKNITPPLWYRGCNYQVDLPPITYVSRNYCSGLALEQKTISRNPPDFPSLEQIFDLGYLAEAFYNRGKKLLSPHVYRKKRSG